MLQHEVKVEPAARAVVGGLDGLSGVELLLRVRLRRFQGRRRDGDAVPPQRRGHAVPIRVDEHAAGVEEDGFDHRAILTGGRAGTVAATARTQPSGSSSVG